MPDTTCHTSIALGGSVAGPDQSRENPLEGLGPRGEHAVGAALSGIDAAVQIEEAAAGTDYERT